MEKNILIYHHARFHQRPNVVEKHVFLFDVDLYLLFNGHTLMCFSHLIIYQLDETDIYSSGITLKTL